jgi:hypothetical protein
MFRLSMAIQMERLPWDGDTPRGRCSLASAGDPCGEGSQDGGGAKAAAALSAEDRVEEPTFRVAGEMDNFRMDDYLCNGRVNATALVRIYRSRCPFQQHRGDRRPRSDLTFEGTAESGPSYSD